MGSVPVRDKVLQVGGRSDFGNTLRILVQDMGPSLGVRLLD